MADPILIVGIPLDFIFFAFILLGIALFHRHTLPIALTGLAVIIGYKVGFTGFRVPFLGSVNPSPLGDVMH